MTLNSFSNENWSMRSCSFVWTSSSSSSSFSCISSISCSGWLNKLTAPDLFVPFLEAITNHSSAGSFHFWLISMHVEVPMSRMPQSLKAGRIRTLLELPWSWRDYSEMWTFLLSRRDLQSKSAKFWTSLSLFALLDICRPADPASASEVLSFKDVLLRIIDLHQSPKTYKFDKTAMNSSLTITMRSMKGKDQHRQWHAWCPFKSQRKNRSSSHDSSCRWILH